MKRLLCFLLLTPISCSALTESTGVPASVSQIKTEVVNGQVVRIVQHNMELNPIIQFEILSRPNFNPIETLTVKELPYNNQELSLSKSSGAFVEDVFLNGSSIEFTIEYFYVEGGSVMLSCEIPVSKNHFDPLQCHKK
ncbi:hypothetical protein [Hahella sp. HN01]|uniref:hypothetical protein n=1 Tax=Hahella sp. HN01 TaxID=2847262 RepID=UPI001C1EAFE5|nr:hypothetical protein [Hahella sp. HN01]MBU6955768.1 hypothetical protein [Hahella sp. HN01]